ncbi:MAG: bifunctional riboflavin kinase/FMN adenylyltransferase [Clostridiales bacterium]|nr:bifunctional riboflavin kinase/FMN adenylyltransferase [Clostridiales bacterium]
MKIYEKESEIGALPMTSLALGFFDGLHIGHQQLIARCREDAKRSGRACAVFTFRENPRNVMAGRTVAPRLQTRIDKHAMLEKLGVEVLFDFAFEDGFHTMPSQVFAQELLVRRFRAQTVFCGFNFRFGKNAAGDADMLIELGQHLGYGVHVLDPVRMTVGDNPEALSANNTPGVSAKETATPYSSGPTVSSTLIRQLIAEGRVEMAADLLGRPYALSGTAVRGNGLGRTLGFPTANFKPDSDMALPAFGVYAAKTLLNGISHPSVLNIGKRPTVDGDRILAETHLLDMDRELYGEELTVCFLKMLRAERKFESLQELRDAIAQNKREAEDWFAYPTG